MDINESVLPISTVTQITKLTPRQIRYYEQQGLIRPMRSTGKQRLFSFNEIEQLLQIKQFIAKGVNISGIKEMLEKKSNEVGNVKPASITNGTQEELSEEDLRKMLKRERIHSTRPGLSHLTHGELSRFF